MGLKTPLSLPFYRSPQEQPSLFEEPSMRFVSLVRKPLVIAMLAAATVAVPVGALYFSGAAHASPSTATQSTAAPASAPAPAGAGPAVALPDFSGMVQKYGPAVVNITVTTKVSASWQGDEGDEGDGDSNGNGDNGGGEQQ